MTTLTLWAVDRSTYVVRAVFRDEDGVSLVPTTLTWSLTSATGTVINSRSKVSLTPAATVDVVLSGADLVAADGTLRVVTIEGTYTSSLGVGLPLKAACRFGVEDLVAVT